MLYEFCAENVTLLEKAMKAGAQRIELCDNLAVGGTTPSYGVIQAAVDLAKPYGATVFTRILKLRLCWQISKKPRKPGVREWSLVS